MVTIDAMPVLAGQTWTCVVGKHKGLPVKIERTNGVSAKVRPLKGDRSIRANVPWHIKLDVLQINYRLVDGPTVDTNTNTRGDDMGTVLVEPHTSALEVIGARRIDVAEISDAVATAHSPQTTPDWKEQMRKRREERYAQLTDDDKLGVLADREDPSVSVSQLLSKWSIDKPVLGMVIRWGIAKGIKLSERPPAQSKQEVPEPDASPIEASDALAALLDIDTTALTGIARLEDVEAAPVEQPASRPAQPVTEGMQRFSVRYVVLKPVEVEETLEALSFGEIELRMSVRQDVHEVLSISKQR